MSAQEDTLLDAVAAKAHAAWVTHLQRGGFQHAELMAPYAELSEAAKEVDRVVVRAVLHAIEDLGLAVD